MNAAPSPLATIRATALGYAPRVLQGRGWVLASLVALPVGLSIIIFTVARMQGADASPADTCGLGELGRVLLK